jgi:hypothetical protein
LDRGTAVAVFTDQSSNDSEVPMEALLSLGTVNLPIPAWQMALYVGLMSLSIIWRKTKCCLLTTYVFVFYWGYYQVSRDLLTAAYADTTAQSAYIGFGLVLITFTLVSLFYEER